MAERVVSFVGYGSLMSAEGLGANLGGVADARRARLGSQRGFAKPAQRGGCLAMDVATGRATLATSEGEGFGCLLLSVRVEATGALARREGYPRSCWARLVAAAGAAGPAAFLLELARGCGDDVLDYRRALWGVTGPTPLEACHYVPHPVETGAEPAIVFVSPNAGETGDPTRPSAKAPYPSLRPVPLGDVLEAAPLFPELDVDRQLRYVELCLLSAAHGVWLGDLLEGLGADHPVRGMLKAWRRDPRPLRAERDALRRVPALRSATEYARRFPATLEEAMQQSGIPPG